MQFGKLLTTERERGERGGTHSELACVPRFMSNGLAARFFCRMPSTRFNHLPLSHSFDIFTPHLSKEGSHFTF